jgi:hypothetical protein
MSRKDKESTDNQTLDKIYQEKETQILTVRAQCEQAEENWQTGLISSKKKDQLAGMFRYQMLSLREECGILYGQAR